MESTIGPARAGAPGAPVSAFSITTPAASVSLNSKGEAAVSFTVTNTSGRALSGDALIVAAAPATEWLKIDGAARRDFPVGGTQQYAVQISVKPEAAPGQYKFRLAERGVSDPDEQYVESSDVAFTVQKSPPPLNGKPAFPWWILVVAGAVILVIAGVVAFLLLRNVTVPNVVGQSAPNAQATLQAGNLALGTLTPKVGPTATPQNTVLDQVPTPGASVGRNSAVNLVVSRPPLSASENDSFNNAFQLSVPGTILGSTRGATTEPGEPVHAGDARCLIISGHVYTSTTWFRFQPGTSGTVTISTANPGTNFDSVLAVYTGSSLAALSLVGCDNNGDGRAADATVPGGPRTPTWSSILHVPVTAGQVYFVQLAGVGGATSGDYNLTISVP